MEREIWRSIRGFEWIYEISNTGIVRSVDRWSYHPENKQAHYLKSKRLKPRINNCGYVDVRLFKNGKIVTRFIHRLMAEAFIPKLPEKEEINHIDGVKTNNSIENLEWVTHQENMAHAYKLGLIKKTSKYTET
ncbi:MAG: NUMOD4 motif-containing HNH endonuclease [Chitinophagaceae bacterium]